MAQPEIASTKKVAQDLAEKWRLDKHLDEDPLLAANRDDRVPSQRAVREFMGAQAPLVTQPQPRESAEVPLVTQPQVRDSVLEPLNQPHQAAESWPVGSVFLGVVATDPALLLGYGTWAPFGAGRVLVGLDSGDTDFDTVEETGGAKTKAISAHADTAVADHASHTHNVTAAGTNSAPTFTGNAVAAAGTSPTPDLVAADTTGTGVSPVITATGTVSAPTFTGSSVTSSGPSSTLTHTVTQPSNHNNLNVVQPYIVVYMWKRTA